MDSSTISRVISRDALEDVALTRFKAIENIHGSLPMNMDNGSISLSKEYWDELKRLGIEPEFTPYKCPSANGIVERFIKMTETQAKTGRLLFDLGFCSFTS